MEMGANGTQYIDQSSSMVLRSEQRRLFAWLLVHGMKTSGQCFLRFANGTIPQCLITLFIMLSQSIPLPRTFQSQLDINRRFVATIHSHHDFHKDGNFQDIPAIFATSARQPNLACFFFR